MFALNGVQVEIAGFPEAKDAAPRGCDTAYVNTWACGPLKPNQQKTFRWSVTAVQAGDYKVSWRVAAGLDGKAKAVAAGGGPAPRGASRARSPTRRPTSAWRTTARRSSAGLADPFGLITRAPVAARAPPDAPASTVGWASPCANRHAPLPPAAEGGGCT